MKYTVHKCCDICTNFYKYWFRHSKVNVADTQTHRQHGDRTRVLLFLQTKENRPIDLKEAVTRMWTGFIGLRIGSNCGFLIRWWTSSSIKRCADFNHPSNCLIVTSLPAFRRNVLPPSAVSLWDVGKHLPDYTASKLRKGWTLLKTTGFSSKKLLHGINSKPSLIRLELIPMSDNLDRQVKNSVNSWVHALKDTWNLTAKGLNRSFRPYWG
jgi:hypothetical protein